MTKAALDFSFTGDKRLIKKLEGLDKKIQRSALRSSIRRAANSLLAITRSYAPVDTGKLAKSLIVRSMRQKRRGEIGFNVRTGTSKELGIDGPVFYPAIQEYGSKKIGLRGLHYMKRAMDSFRPTYKKAITVGLKTFLNRLNSK